MGALYLMGDAVFSALPFSRRPHILIACLPKSGSTFLAETLGALPGMRRCRLTPAWGDREQELCQIRLSRNNHRRYVAQHHLRHSDWTQQLIGTYGLTPIVLVRNLSDCVVSVCDHLRREPQSSPMSYFAPEHLDLSEDELQEAVVRLTMPWYLNFCMGWRRDERALFVSYEDVVADPAVVMGKILDQAGAKYTRRDIEQALARSREKYTRFNVGVSGRGRALCAPAARALARMLDFYPEIRDDPRLVRPDER